MSGIINVGLSSSSQSNVAVIVSNSPNATGTKICFATRPPSTIVNNTTSAILTQLDEMLSFASNQERTLQSQTVATRLALSKLRSHEMTLRAQALKATVRALHADNETKFVREQFEVELGEMHLHVDAGGTLTVGDTSEIALAEVLDFTDFTFDRGNFLLHIFDDGVDGIFHPVGVEDEGGAVVTFVRIHFDLCDLEGSWPGWFRCSGADPDRKGRLGVVVRR